MKSTDFNEKLAKLLGKNQLSHDDLQEDFILNSIVGQEDSDETFDPMALLSSLYGMQCLIALASNVLMEEIAGK